MSRTATGPIACNQCCDPCGSSCSLLSQPWALPQPFEGLGIKVGGWLQTGYTYNAKDPGDNFNGPIQTNDRAGEFQMNQAWLFLDKPCDTSKTGYALGAHADIVYGTDWRVAAAHGFGLEDRLNGNDQFYGWIFPQFYVEPGVGPLSIKVGRMAGILGYEQIPSPMNFFYSHSFGTCHTKVCLIAGALAKLKVNKQLEVQAGVHNGVFRFDDDNDNKNFHGQIKWTSPCNILSFAYGLDFGRVGPPGVVDLCIHNFILTAKLTEKLDYVAESYIALMDTPNVGTGTAEWYNLAHYLYYKVNDKLSLGTRAEWFRDDDGFGVSGLGAPPLQPSQLAEHRRLRW